MAAPAAAAAPSLLCSRCECGNRVQQQLRCPLELPAVHGCHPLIHLHSRNSSISNVKEGTAALVSPGNTRATHSALWRTDKLGKFDSCQFAPMQFFWRGRL